MEKGHIDISNLNTPPEQAEFETAKYFAGLGKNLTFIRPSSIPKQHRPDILMDGIEWEIKCPEGRSKRTIENNLRAAEKQSHYIIIDLRRIKIPEKRCLSEIEINFKTKPGIKRILVITKELKLIEFPPHSN
jgi:hypothetical protein